MLYFLITNKIEKKRVDMIAKKFPLAKILARGRHAVVLLNNGYCIKIEKDIPAAKNAISSEAKWLKYMQGKDFASKFKEYDKKLRYIIYRYVEGKYLPNFLDESNKKRSITVVKKCLEICRELDKLGINKGEMHKPVKHVIVDYPKVTFIDWERCHKTKKPKNVTQFTSYLFQRGQLKDLDAVKQYKKSYSDKDFKKIVIQ